MAENIGIVQTEGAAPEQPVAPATEPAAEPAAEPERRFTQAEVDAAIERRLARERRGMPSKEELETFRTWQENHQSEADRQKKILDERNGYERRVQELEEELERTQRERDLLGRGVPADDVDYYAYKIGRMVSDTLPFEKAAEQFLAQRDPQKNAPAAQPGSVRASFGAPMGTGVRTETLAERINRQLRN